MLLRPKYAKKIYMKSMAKYLNIYETDEETIYMFIP